MHSFPSLEPVCCSMSSSNCCFLTCKQISQEAGQVVWYFLLFKNTPQFIVIHTVKGFGVVSEAEVDVFLEFSCLFYHPTDVGNLISGSSAYAKSSLNIWKFSGHVLLKPGWENFEHYFASQMLTVLFHLISPSMWVKQEKDKLYPPSYSLAYLLHCTSQFRSHLEQQGPTKGRSQGIWSTNSHSQECMRMCMTG